MQSHKQWLNWELIDGKKLPLQKNGSLASVTNPEHYMTYEEALATGRGLAFVFTENDPFFFCDIDDALVNGKWDDRAINICNMFAGCGVEVSQSGTGLHIIGRGTPTEPNSTRSKKNTLNNVEFYTQDRFIAIARPLDTWTGNVNHIVSSEIIDNFFNVYMPKKSTPVIEGVIVPTDWTSTHVEGAYPIESDQELIAKALISENVSSIFGGDNLSFRDLWERNIPALCNAFPDDKGYDESRADASLAQRLAFWTGSNCERMLKLMMRSALKRDKWLDRADYLQRTIMAAVARQDKFYDVGKPIVIPEQSNEPQQRTGLQLLGRDQMIEYFKGCVYVTDAHKMLLPNGQMLRPEQFNAKYGGYLFTLDDIGEKTTKKAWEAFTESQHTAFPKVDTSSFRPRIPSGAIFMEEGLRVVNTYVPCDIPMYSGDITPFLIHLDKLFPVERDKQIILSYMAACVQFPGYKFQWAPLIQGCEGNGKTLFTRCVAQAVGEKYTHFPPASEIGEKFNAWLFEKLFIGVEDIYVPQAKSEVLEILKPMITSERLAKRAMQQDQRTEYVCANFMFNSNHKDAIRKTENDRRFAVFYTPQQSHSDLVRDGMTGNYFPNLYKWLKDKGGYAQVAFYLKHYPIMDEFNPVTDCNRAPVTSSTNEAVTASMGAVEQEIMNHVEEGAIGFRGDWVSGTHLDTVIKNLRMERAVPRNKREVLMQTLGYEVHPAMTKGRANNPIFTDGGKKSRLYIRVDSPYVGLSTNADAVRQYEEDQK